MNFSGRESNYQTSFGHNLCFKYPNGSCELIWNIYIPRDFQWHKEFFNLMNFDPFNHPLKIRESIETPTPKVETHLGVWGFIPSHFPTLLEAWNVTHGLHSWPAPLQAYVVSLKLGLRHLMSLYKGEVLFVWSSNNMQPKVDYVIIIQPFISWTMCFGINVTNMFSNKFQLGCIFLMLNLALWAIYLNLQVENRFCFSIIFLFQVPIHALFPLPFPLPPFSLFYKLAIV